MILELKYCHLIYGLKFVFESDKCISLYKSVELLKFTGSWR
jgi:hypothetical protein